MISSITSSIVLANGITNPALPEMGSGVEVINNILAAVITLLLTLGVIYFVYNLILGAIYWISSGGDKTKLQMARDKIVQAVIAFVILLSVYALLGLIGAVFGLNLIELPVFTFSDAGPATPGLPICSGVPPDPSCWCTNTGWFCPWDL